MNIECTECKIPIKKSKWDVNNFKHLFCSRTCKEIFYKKLNEEERICKECHSTFKTTKLNPKTFCNNSCSASFNNKNNIKEKECKNCLIKFKRLKTGKKIDNYCSEKCLEENVKPKELKGRTTPIKIAVQNWRKKTKEKIVKTMGGECQLCGYKRSFNALDLHHLNPENKELSLANALKNPKKWEIIEKELKKCVLLCCNCHREVHAGIKNIENKLYFDETTIKEIEPEKSFCPICNVEKNKNLKFCSPACYKKSRIKIDWDNLNFEDLIKQFKNSEQIGKSLGVSGAVVRKERLKRGI